MADVDRLEAIAQTLEEKAGVVPSVAEKRDVSKEAKLRRIAVATAALQLTDAPEDGTLYARRDGEWDAIPDAATVEWGEINGTLADQADLQAALDAKSDTSHTHVEADIADLQDYSLDTHTHLEADITDLQSYSLDSHTHLEADITDLQSYSLDSHTHLVGDITNFDRSVTFTLQYPEDLDDYTMFFTDRAITVTEIQAVRTDGTDIDFTLYHGTTAHATTNTLVARTSTSSGGGDTITSFTDETIPADSFITYVQGTTGGTPTEISITIFYTED